MLCLYVLFHITFKVHSSGLDADDLTWDWRFSFSANWDKKNDDDFHFRSNMIETPSFHRPSFFCLFYLAEIILFLISNWWNNVQYHHTVKLDYSQIFLLTLSLRNQIHSYNTRNANTFHVPHAVQRKLKTIFISVSGSSLFY